MVVEQRGDVLRRLDEVVDPKLRIPV